MRQIEAHPKSLQCSSRWRALFAETGYEPRNRGIERDLPVEFEYGVANRPIGPELRKSLAADAPIVMAERKDRRGEQALQLIDPALQRINGFAKAHAARAFNASQMGASSATMMPSFKPRATATL